MASMGGLKLSYEGLLRGGNSSFSNFTINSAGGTIDRIAYIFIQRDDATITHVGFRYGARTGTPVAHLASIQSLDTSGLPSGTILGGGSPASVAFTPPADATWNGTWRKLTLDNSIALVGGTGYALVIEPTGTPDGSNNSSFTRSVAFQNPFSTCLPYPATQTDAAAFTRVAARPIYALYSDSAVFGNPIVSVYGTALGTNGHRFAGRWTPSSSMFSTVTLLGLRIALGTNTGGGSLKVCAWQDTTEVASGTHDTDLVGSVGDVNVFFTDPIALTAGTAYRLGIERVDVSVTAHGITGNTSNELLAYGPSGYLALSTWNGSSWTDDDTTILYAEPIISDITGGSGGTAGPPANLLGGIFQ